MGHCNRGITAYLGLTTNHYKTTWADEQAASAPGVGRAVHRLVFAYALNLSGISNNQTEVLQGF